jgi:hypothetical protein
VALDASEILGSKQLAAVKVNPRGMGKRVAAPYTGMYGAVGGGVVGSLIGGAVSAATTTKATREKQEAAQASETPKFGRLAYLVVTPDEVALVHLKSKIVSLVLDEVIARVPRGDVTGIELDKGGLYSPPLTVTFSSGDSWALEVPKPSVKSAKAVIDELSR